VCSSADGAQIVAVVAHGIWIWKSDEYWQTWINIYISSSSSSSSILFEVPYAVSGIAYVNDLLNSLMSYVMIHNNELFND
jgi:hypothetical protein